MVVDISATSAIAMNGTLVDLDAAHDLCTQLCDAFEPDDAPSSQLEALGTCTLVIAGLLLLSALMAFPYSDAVAPNKGTKRVCGPDPDSQGVLQRFEHCR
ncbi:hypothetical protein DFQ27_004882 [Actinomortierella ambigua]|uniref:Uncharacterized protein n=1 Tax=Actinomortierella ambigua TaxID=1343610 RepID=A0A9P6Q3W4_9FUNG|nr:hypothetical protein DFQ27_004882 [Actinomortierella ambigua]